MDSNLVARVNVDAYCPKIRKKRQNVHSHVGCPKPSVWKMEIIVHITWTIHHPNFWLPLFLRCDTTASEPIPTRWAPNMGGKTHLIQARPKDLCFSLHFPIHTRWAEKQTRLGRNRCRQKISIGAGL